MRSVDPGIIAVFMIFAIPLVAIIGGIFIAALKILKGNSGGSRTGGPDLEMDEAELIQEMHRSLSRMDKRIEALETILLERTSIQEDDATKNL